MNFLKKTFIVVFVIIFSLQISFAEESYKLTMKDKLLVNDISNKINKFIDIKGDVVTTKYVFTINKTIKKTDKNSKIYQILNGIKANIVNYTNDKYKQENNITETTKEVETKGNYKSKTNFSDFKIDMTRVRTSWLGFYNEVRKSKLRTTYSYDSKLNDTAEEWVDTSLTRGVISHKRDTNDSYYNYNKINSWFKDRGIVCKNINSITNSENIGRGYYKCSDSNDCTNKLIGGIKQVFDMYMAEKGKSNQVHYESIVKKEFSKIGLGIAIKKLGTNSYEFYITTHFCTQLQ
ncbi:MAG: CAP domain-containing protein [Candidatus Gracilibacteria bacterium]